MRNSTATKRLIPGAALVILLSLGGAPAEAQQSDCIGGWAQSCASVEVSAAGDQLLFYVPNAVAPAAGRATTEDAARRALARGRAVRVYRSAPGDVCDPATGRGCVDVTKAWLEADARAEEDDEEEEDGCVDGERRVSEVEGDSVVVTAKDRDAECAGYLPNLATVGAVTFALTIPITTPLWLDPGRDPITVGSAREDGEDGSEGDDGENSQNQNDGSGQNQDDGSGGDGGDSGTSGDGGDGTSGDDAEGNSGDSTSGGGDGDSGNSDGSDGSDDSGTENSGTENSSEGNGGGDGNDGEGNDGNGNDGNGNGGDGDGGEGETPWPGSSEVQPPMTEVPEPVSTTLVGLGLLGYAGARARRRRREDEEPDGIG